MWNTRIRADEQKQGEIRDFLESSSEITFEDRNPLRVYARDNWRSLRRLERGEYLALSSNSLARSFSTIGADRAENSDECFSRFYRTEINPLIERDQYEGRVDETRRFIT